MTYSAPGPRGQDIFFGLFRNNPEVVVEQTRENGEPPVPGFDPGERSIAGLLEHERARTATRAADDADAADEALREVAIDLAVLFDRAAVHVRDSGRGGVRKQVRETLPRLRTDLAVDPVRELADLLGLPADPALETLRRDGGVTPAERVAALNHLSDLRDRVGALAADADHAAMDVLVRAVARVAVVVSMAVDAADPAARPIVTAAAVVLVTRLAEPAEAAPPALIDVLATATSLPTLRHALADLGLLDSVD